MLTIVILLILLAGFIVGLRRGLILQIVHMFGFVVAFIIAAMMYNDLAPKLKLWVPFPSSGESTSFRMLFETIGLEEAFYHALAFFIIFVAVRILLQLVGSMLDFLSQFPLLKQFNHVSGGAVGLVEAYLGLFIVLYIAAMLPVELVQNQLQQSALATFIVTDTPILTNLIKGMWFQTFSA